MSNAYNLLVESPNYELKYLVEEKNRNSPSNLFIQGPFLMADKPNRNNRIYPRNQMVEEVNRYTSEMIVNQRSTGELNHPSCHLKTAEILTNKGFISFENLDNDANIYTLNLESNEIELHQINKKIVSDYNGEMYHIKGRNIDTYVTPTHRFPIELRYGKREFVTAEEIYKNRTKYNKCKFLKTGDWSVETPEFYILKGDNYKNAKKCKGDITNDVSIRFETFVKFLGIYLAEGHCSDPNTQHTDGFSVHISQKKESVRDKIRELLKEFPEEMEWKETSSDFRICDKRLHNLLFPLGNCYDKYIPHDFKNLSSFLLEELIYWFNLGDGRFSITCHENEYIQRNVFSTSKKLIDDLQECLLKSGGSGNINTILTESDYKFADRIIKAENKVPLYQLSLSTSKHIYLDSRFLKIEKVNLDQDQVYCVNVNNGNFYCRENGKTFWSGNSPEVNLERACHMVTELKQNGDIFEGKSKILSTPMGQIVRSLIMDGVKLGVSSRALGRVDNNKQGVGVVSDFRLVAIDVVADPSVPTAFVNGILESKKWVLAESGEFEPFYDTFEKAISKLPSKDRDAYLKEQFITFINAIKKL